MTFDSAAYLRGLQEDPPEADNRSLLQREWEVLGGGFADGLGQAASNLKEGAQAFVRNPLDATAGYLTNHWKDVAVGAGIAFVSPRGLVNAALVAYSMRGVAESTITAAGNAADPTLRLSETKAQYAEAMGREATAFLGTLPAAGLGGWAGKAAANNVFGRNMGAYDLFAGNVTGSQVKANLWGIADTVRPPRIKLVVSDLDNTLGSFTKYWSEGLEAGIGDMSVRLNRKGYNIDENTLYQLIGERTSSNRSHEYPWVVEMALHERLGVGQPGKMSVSEFHSDIVAPFWRHIDDAMVRTFEPFPGVIPTLTELKARNIPVAILSDAPGYVGLRRATHLQLDRGYVDRMFSLNNQIPPELPGPLLAHGESRVANFLATPHGMQEFRLIPKSWEKPHADGFNLLVERYGVRPKEVLMIGDSRVKDMGVAQNGGAGKALYAEYGQPAQVWQQRLDRLEPPSTPNPGAKPKVYPPYEVAQNFGDVLNHLQPSARPTEIVGAIARSFVTTPNPRSLFIAYRFPLGSEESERRTQQGL